MRGLPWPICYVTSQSDKTVLYALDVEMVEDTIRWIDGARERFMSIDNIVEDTTSRFVFQRAQSEGGASYTFVPMTLAIYHEKVMPYILMPQTFTSEEDLYGALREARRNVW